MILDEIVLHNFGVFKDRQVLNLTPSSSKKPVILFGGFNGGGKTTILDALQLSLYGKLAFCSNRGSLSYEEFLRRSIHRSVDPNEGASLEIQFRYNREGREHTYRINRSWAQNGNGLREKLDVFIDGSLDRVLAESWAEHVEEFIPLGISSLFFFDGEKIEALANSKSSVELLSKAVHSLLGIDLIEKLRTDLIVLEKKKTGLIKNDSMLIQIKGIEEDYILADKKYQELFQERANLRNVLQRQEKQFHEAEKKFNREGGLLYDQRKELESNHRETQNMLFNIESELRELAEGPAPLILVKGILQNIRSQVAKEDNFFKANILKNELKERDTKLLKKLKSLKVAGKVLVAFKDFLEQDRIENSRNSNTECYLNVNGETKRHLQNEDGFYFKNHHEKIKCLLDDADKLQNNLIDLDRKIASIPDHETVEKIIEEKGKAGIAIQNTIQKIKIIDEVLERLKRERDKLKNTLSALNEKMVENDFQQEGNARILQHSKKARKTLDNFRNAVLNRHVKRIEKQVFMSFRQLLHKKSLVTNLRIDPKSFTLELFGKNGKVLPLETLSAGERQLLAVSILWGLGRASGRPLPVVIDTPLGRLDASHRANMIQNYFPNASHQVLLLSTDEEIDEKYYQRLKPSVGRTYRLDFDNSKDATQVKNGYFWK